jgi:hypothetical protein
MPEIKLAQNQDRTPVRLTICVSPELNDWLRDYAGFYEAAYGQPVALANSGDARELSGERPRLRSAPARGRGWAHAVINPRSGSRSRRGGGSSAAGHQPSASSKRKMSSNWVP